MPEPTTAADLEHLLLEMRGSVAVLTFNRPQRLNAMPPAMFDEIRIAIGLLAGMGARALVMTGAGRAFCSGVDLLGRTAAVPGTRGPSTHRLLSDQVTPMMQALAKLRLPVVTAVNGAAAGVGCSLALASDFTLAARSAYFLQAFVNIGLVPDGGSTWMLSRLIGKARATEMMMLGERISAEKAENWGLIHRAVDDADLMPQALALAERLASGPTLALGLMRQGIASGLSQSYDEALATEALHQSMCANSADAVEGGVAFFERRKPAFTGA